MDSRLILIVFSIYLTKGSITFKGLAFIDPLRSDEWLAMQCNALYCGQVRKLSSKLSDLKAIFVPSGLDAECQSLGKQENR